MSSQSSKLKLLAHVRGLRAILLSVSMLVGIHSSAIGAPPQGTARKIVSEDFTKNRQTPASADASAKASPGKPSNKVSSRPKPPRTYRLASPPASSSRPTSPGAVVAQLGITMWRLRQVVANDSGARMLVREKGKSSEWVPERVEADTPFREGDHVRLSIESPRTGYLYVVDRELFADGTTGDAMLIYPWADLRGGNNEMRPGKLVDIPAQDDEPSYFTARRSRPDQVGEILTVIITLAPLDLPISDQPLRISAAELSKWEKMWETQSERFEMEGGAGETWTPEEQQAAATKGSRQLTQDDPAPQTIFRLSAAGNSAFLVNIRLRYAK